MIVVMLVEANISEGRTEQSVIFVMLAEANISAN